MECVNEVVVDIQLAERKNKRMQDLLANCLNPFSFNQGDFCSHKML